MIIFSIDGSPEVTINKAIDIIGVVCLTLFYLSLYLIGRCRAKFSLFFVGLFQFNGDTSVAYNVLMKSI